MSVYTRPLRSDELMHFGIRGMHWGVRRYQNPDGTLTDRGRKRYNISSWEGNPTGITNKREAKHYKKSFKKNFEAQTAEYGISNSATRMRSKAIKNAQEDLDKYKASEPMRKRVATGAKIAAAALTVYGAKKVLELPDVQKEIHKKMVKMAFR